MAAQQGQSEKEARRKERRDAEDAGRLAKEQERRKAYFAKERAAQAVSDKRQSERAEKRVAEDVERLLKEQARKKAYSAREKNLADDQEGRRLREKK